MAELLLIILKILIRNRIIDPVGSIFYDRSLGSDMFFRIGVIIRMDTF